MTHAERRARRVAMAEMIRGGADLAAVCHAYGVTVHTVYQAIREAGDAVLPRARVLADSSFAIIARLATTDDSLAAIAADYGLSCQRVQQIYAKCRAFGVPVRERPHGRPQTTRLASEGTALVE